MEVTHYGLHWTEGKVAFLEQGSAGQNALGLSTRSPFVVKNRIPCNHQIPINVPDPSPVHIQTFKALLTRDDLIKTMLPIPREPGDRAFFVGEDNPDLDLALLALQRLSSPINTIIYPFWSLSMERLQRLLGETNVQPLVLVSAGPSYSNSMRKASKMTYFNPRTLIVVADHYTPLPKGFKPIRTEVHHHLRDLVSLPLETLGGWVLRSFMRGELSADMWEIDECK